MLPARARLRANREFQAAFRSGVRVGRPTLVVHALFADPHSSDGQRPPRVGFVVSKKVGGAVVRNRVKRQLRHLVAAELAAGSAPEGLQAVVRALPPATDSTQLSADLRSAWPAAVARAHRRAAPDGGADAQPR